MSKIALSNPPRRKKGRFSRPGGRQGGKSAVSAGTCAKRLNCKSKFQFVRVTSTFFGVIRIKWKFFFKIIKILWIFWRKTVRIRKSHITLGITKRRSSYFLFSEQVSSTPSFAYVLVVYGVPLGKRAGMLGNIATALFCLVAQRCLCVKGKVNSPQGAHP